MTDRLKLAQLLAERFSFPAWFFRPRVPRRDPADDNDDRGEDDK